MNFIKYSTGKLIGEGKYGRIYECFKRSDKQQKYAVKIIPNKYQNIINNEKQILLEMDHPHIIKLHDYYINPIQTYFILDYAQNDLYNLMETGKFSLRESFHIIHDIADALSYLHDKGYIHYDLKPENILLVDTVVKLCDFGFTSKDTTLRWGTMLYLAPELVLGTGHDHRVDIWALGVLLYELITETLPFCHESDGEVRKQILQCDYDLPSDLSIEVKNLIRSLICKDPEQRISLQELKPTLKAMMEK